MLLILEGEAGELTVDPASTGRHHRVLLVAQFREGILLQKVLSVGHVVSGDRHVSS